MLKASALNPVKMNETVPEMLGRNTQNIVIECSKNAEVVPNAVEQLALKMLHMDFELKSILSDLRTQYRDKKEDFHISLAGQSNFVKDAIVDLFKKLYGVVSEVHYCAEREVLNGRLVFTPKAQGFLSGSYMEIAIAKVVKDIVGELSKKYQKTFKVYNNVKIATRDGRIKNEFDLVIENVSDSLIYVVEVKSGKNFSDVDKLARIGKEYGIIPHRLLLIDNYMEKDDIETIEYFCEYYVANLLNNCLEKKVTLMLENDLLVEETNEQ